MPEYLVEWCIELEADSSEDAARKALAIQRDPNSMATAFEVVEAEGGEAIHINVQTLDDEDDLIEHGVLHYENN